jgi:energy-coupling factor transporter ATP-binding protein EcfA2
VKTYGPLRALDGFTLSAAAGEIVGLVGHNGAGKTTFVEVVAGLVRPEASRVRVGGVDPLARPRAARALMGISPQETALYPAATVAEHLRLFGALAGLRRAALRSQSELNVAYDIGGILFSALGGAPTRPRSCPAGPRRSRRDRPGTGRWRRCAGRCADRSDRRPATPRCWPPWSPPRARSRLGG